jgi:membrane protein required for colicin V production
MNLADWAIAAMVLISVVMAVFQGFFYEAFSLAGAVVGYLVAAWQYHRIAGWIAPYVKSDWVADIAGFLVLFLAALILASLVGRGTRWLMREVGLRWFDRLLGAAFGLVRGCLIVAVVLLGTTSFAPNSHWLTESQLAPYFLVVGRAVIWLAPSQLRIKFYEGIALLRDAHKPAVVSPERREPRP